jgi:uncharacterized membrane protein
VVGHRAPRRRGHRRPCTPGGPGTRGLGPAGAGGHSEQLRRVALILFDAGSAEGGTKAAIIGLALAGVVLSWLLVHTLFTLRYATLYFRANNGVDFNKRQPPRYADFAYLAFTIGMTFQVSDTSLTTDATRYTVLRQALLSYVLGTIVLATTINLVAGLVR